jgi:hypothetical protein
LLFRFAGKKVDGRELVRRLLQAAQRREPAPRPE